LAGTAGTADTSLASPAKPAAAAAAGMNENAFLEAVFLLAVADIQPLPTSAQVWWSDPHQPRILQTTMYFCRYPRIIFVSSIFLTFYVHIIVCN
jgi:hypothetical protein